MPKSKFLVLFAEQVLLHPAVMQCTSFDRVLGGVVVV